MGVYFSVEIIFDEHFNVRFLSDNHGNEKLFTQTTKFK